MADGTIQLNPDTFRPAVTAIETAAADRTRLPNDTSGIAITAALPCMDSYKQVLGDLLSAVDGYMQLLGSDDTRLYQLADIAEQTDEDNAASIGS
jgi:hypothetical protein